MSISNEELNNIGVYQWENLVGKHKKLDLLVGNGFSINFSNKFMYRSIFEDFESRCADIYKHLFAQFQTTNFEEIMLMLVNAKKVNSIFGLSTAEVEQAIEVLKEGLIASINALHPRTDDVPWKAITSIGTQIIDEFQDVYSTNYDLLLYHILMATIDFQRYEKAQGRKRDALQDYCWGDMNAEYKEFMDYQSYGGYRHLYYLHGNLCLFNQGLQVLKLKRGNRDTELIDLIAQEIRKGHFPLFVSEGSAQEKLSRVTNNLYLKFCFEHLRKSRNPLLIFGLTLAPNDEHIIAQIKSNPRPLVIAIYPEGKNEIELKAERINQMLKFGNGYGREIDFVDSRSVFDFDVS